ncbi:MAG: T9SS type A sorting domain-containing protein [Thermonemataceae bacterium]|nr:T9SS type A sorting domain-containing protein [Thermonemataceae bacterium]
MKKSILLFIFIVLVAIEIKAQTLIDPAGDGGFETGATFAANGWTFVNDGRAGVRNDWAVGNPTGVGATVSRAAFISNDGGTTYVYSTGRNSVSHFYRDIIVPANTTVDLSFNWKADGESGFDYLRVFVVPTTTTPVGGTQLTTGQVGGDFNSQGTWQTVTNLNLGCNNTGSSVTRRLVFSWRNDNSAGTQPPAAVDNISVVASPIPATCNLGTGVTNVAALPYNSGAGTTCGAIDDLTSANTVTCGSTSYLGGEDAVWVFTAPSTGQVSIDLTSAGTWTGLMVYDGCPTSGCSSVPAGTCVTQSQSSTGNKSLCFNATAGTTYYVVLDVFPSPSCNTYTNLSIAYASSTCNLGTGVTSVATLPYSSGAGTTCGAVNDLTSANTATCGSTTYLAGEDRVWSFTPTSSGIVTMNLTSGGSNTGLMLYDACPSFGSSCSIPTASCVAQVQSATGSKTLCANVTAGTTYYLVLDATSGCNAYTDLTISAPGAPTCSLGTGVTNVATLPYSSGAGTTAGAVDDITSANVTAVCGSTSYYTGQDRVWVFTPTTTGSINIDLISTGSYTGLMLYDGCPVGCGATGVCVAETQSSTGNKSLCVNVTAGRTYYLILDSWASPATNPYDNLTISAPVSGAALSCTLAGTYTMSTIAHNPDVLTSANLSGFTDDIFYPGGTIATGFDFCLNGVQYQNFLISANAYVIFAPPSGAGCSATNLPGGDNAAAGDYSAWSISEDVPNTTDAPRNAILAPWHDIDPSVTTGGANPIIRYQVFGTAPNRRFVVSWEAVPMFDCDADRTLDFTGQIKMFETTNDIEIHVRRKRLCSTWNDGNAVLGLHNYNGTEALVPAGRNSLDANWTATNEAYRFTFNPATCTTCTPLPLNLLFFTGEWDKVNIQAKLSWAFKTPVEAAYYVVERSTDEINFTEIGKIENTNANSYNFTDKTPLRGTNIYRIKQMGKDGKVNYSHNIRINNPIEEVWAIDKLYPNPTTDRLNIEITSLAEELATIKLLNLQGLEVFNKEYVLKKGANTIDFSVANLPKGTYLVLVRTATQIKNTKIIVE